MMEECGMKDLVNRIERVKEEGVRRKGREMEEDEKSEKERRNKGKGERCWRVTKRK